MRGRLLLLAFSASAQEQVPEDVLPVGVAFLSINASHDGAAEPGLYSSLR
ncbi:MAG: hypothetical protein R3F62_24235 [Planctomycetota bacterium]